MFSEEKYKVLEKLGYMPFSIKLKDRHEYNNASLSWFDKDKIGVEDAFCFSVKRSNSIEDYYESEIEKFMIYIPYFNDSTEYLDSLNKRPKGMSSTINFPIDEDRELEHSNDSLHSYKNEADILCVNIEKLAYLEDFLRQIFTSEKTIQDFLEASKYPFYFYQGGRILVNIVRQNRYRKYYVNHLNHGRPTPVFLILEEYGKDMILRMVGLQKNRGFSTQVCADVCTSMLVNACKNVVVGDEAHSTYIFSSENKAKDFLVDYYKIENVKTRLINDRLAEIEKIKENLDYQEELIEKIKKCDSLDALKDLKLI